MQLKILQALPPLVQNYGSELNGELLGKTLLICSELQTSRTAVVHSTAAATLQQLVVAVYDKLASEDGAHLLGFTRTGGLKKARSAGRRSHRIDRQRGGERRAAASSRL